VGNTYREHREAIRTSIETLDRNYREMHKVQIEHGEAIAVLKVKATVWGMLGGFVPAAVVVMVLFLKEWLSR
jgi:hypothetical protein